MERRLYRLTVFSPDGAKRYVGTLDVLLLWLVRRGGASWRTRCYEIKRSHYRIGTLAELERLQNEKE